jgi:hypothetical protein
MEAIPSVYSGKQPLNEESIMQLIERYSRPASEVILDDVDLRNLLKISRRTALEYRKKEIFPSYKIENKIFYILSEVIDGIRKQKGNHEN